MCLFLIHDKSCLPPRLKSSGCFIICCSYTTAHSYIHPEVTRDHPVLMSSAHLFCLHPGVIAFHMCPNKWALVGIAKRTAPGYVVKTPLGYRWWILPMYRENLQVSSHIGDQWKKKTLLIYLFTYFWFLWYFQWDGLSELWSKHSHQLFFNPSGQDNTN